MTRRTIIDISVIIVHRTEKAVLIKDAENAKPVWLPLSQVEIEGGSGEIGELTLPEWLAQEKGLI
jgi:hypothetical protein